MNCGVHVVVEGLMSASRWSCPGTRELGVIRRNVIRRNPRCVGLRLENTMMVPAEDRQPNIFSKILKIDSDPHPHMRKHSVVPCARRQSSTKKSTQSDRESAPEHDAKREPQRRHAQSRCSHTATHRRTRRRRKTSESSSTAHTWSHAEAGAS